MMRRKPSLTRARKKRFRYIAKLCNLPRDELSRTIDFMTDQGYDLNKIEQHLLGNILFFSLVTNLAEEKNQDFIDVLSAGISIYETVAMLVRINPGKYNNAYRYCMRHL